MHTFKQKIKYRFELFMSKGGVSIFASLLIIFLLSFIFIVLIRLGIVYFFGYSDFIYNTVDSFWDHGWYAFLQMTDPGNMYQDSMQGTGLIKISTVIAGFTGVIIFSALIAFITTEIEKVLHNFRKGTGAILEKNHTVIFGWNSRIIGLLEELIIANESNRQATVVIISDEEKEKMDEYITRNIANTKTLRIITTTGNSSSIKQFHRLSLKYAKSIIILSSSNNLDSETEKTESDVKVIKSILALNSFFYTDISIPVIVEIFYRKNKVLIDMLNNENIVVLDSWSIMGKILTQTSLASGLQIVYNEILSFSGNEIYFYKNSEYEGITFKDLPYYFEDGIPVGVNNSGGVSIHPDNDYILKSDDEVIILATDDSAIHFSKRRKYTPRTQEILTKTLKTRPQNILILGWHDVGKIFAQESNEYLLKGTIFEVVIHNPNQEFKENIKHIDDMNENISINIIDTNPMVIENLESINPFDYDMILILATDVDETSEDRVDSNTILVLLMLQKINLKLNKKTKIVTQILNSANQELMTQTKVDDFLMSNKMTTMILAQLSEDLKMKLFYDDIFQESGSEIYIKPVYLYFNSFPTTVSFADIMDMVQQRGEICLGILKESNRRVSDKNFGVTLNIPKNKNVTLTKDDFIVVLANNHK